MPGHVTESSPNAPNALAGDAMGTKDLIFTVLAALAPLTLIVAVAPLHFLMGGASVPGGYLVAGVVMALFAVGFMTMSRYVRNAGAFYATISRGLGKPVGSGAAMLAIAAYNALQISTYGALGVYATQTFKNYFHRDVPWYVFALVCVVLVAWLGYRGIHTSSRILGVLLVLETAVLVVLAVYVLAKGGAGHWSAESFAPGKVLDPRNGAMFALVAGAFMGFEATAIFSEEARGGIRTVRRATYIAVGFIAVFYAFITWIVVMAYGADKIAAAAEADPVNLVVAVFDAYVPAPITEVMHVLLLTSAFAALLALHNAANRYFFAMGREGLLPRALGRVHPRTKAPWVAGLAQTALAAVAVAAFAAFGLDPYLGLLLWGSTLGFLGIISLWALCCLAIIRFLRRQAPEAGLFRTTIAPGLSFLALAVVLFLVLTNLPLLTGAGTATNVVIVGVGLAAFVIGVARTLRLRARSPQLYAGLARTSVDETPAGREELVSDHG
ncbi:amino acid/polyamine/organocation transporter, APC superfamily [Streptosporangium canum]|uniref:Amino acid/polyamine/organocation transporter, APC superfamily n=1 Tax=Streptosporangium canum TaxID=324952 RepID=A0A1I4D9T0_9ACTN|nr:APC family permease [Streptosporangium canum]SFK89763.1 amino acid/polyamine/organocation transporter, APC superfamily [Streptosporangium canum]